MITNCLWPRWHAEVGVGWDPDGVFHFDAVSVPWMSHLRAMLRLKIPGSKRKDMWILRPPSRVAGDMEGSSYPSISMA